MHYSGAATFCIVKLMFSKEDALTILFSFRDLDYLLMSSYNAYCMNERNRGVLEPILNPRGRKRIGK